MSFPAKGPSKPCTKEGLHEGCRSRACLSTRAAVPRGMSYGGCGGRGCQTAGGAASDLCIGKLKYDDVLLAHARVCMQGARANIRTYVRASVRS